MSTDTVKKVIKEFLTTDTPEVLAIKGKWGTGKTHTWESVLNEINNDNKLSLETYSYISLFGINSLDELKLKIFEQKVNKISIEKGPSIKTLNDLRDDLIINRSKKAVFPLINFGKKSLYYIFNLFPWFKKPDPFIYSAAFMSIKNTIICLDDFERKGKGLTSTDVLGLTSLLKESKNCKIVLIFNNSYLDEKEKENKDTYQTFREKVVDIEISFSPTNKECTALVFDDTDEIDKKLKEYSQRLNITNIRILQKIRKTAHQVCAFLKDYEEGVINEACKTLTLYIWCFSSGEKSKPTWDFVTNPPLILSADIMKAPEEERPWYQLLSAYRHYSKDKFNAVLAKIVENGYIIESDLIEQAKRTNKPFKIGKNDDSFFDAWHQLLGSFTDTDKALDIFEKEIISIIDVINVRHLNATVSVFRELDQNEIADKLINLYLEKNKYKESVLKLDKYDLRDEMTDPNMIRRFEEEQKKQNGYKQKDSLKKVLDFLLKTHTLSDEKKAFLSGTTPDEYYNFFKIESGKNLYLYIKGLQKFGQSPDSSDSAKIILKNTNKALKRLCLEHQLNVIRLQKNGIILE